MFKGTFPSHVSICSHHCVTAVFHSGPDTARRPFAASLRQSAAMAFCFPQSFISSPQKQPTSSQLGCIIHCRHTHVGNHIRLQSLPVALCVVRPSCTLTQCVCVCVVAVAVYKHCSLKTLGSTTLLKHGLFDSTLCPRPKQTMSARVVESVTLPHDGGKTRWGLECVGGRSRIKTGGWGVGGLRGTDACCGSKTSWCRN